MPEEIFDQDRPRSKMARRLDEAFAGCEEWTVAPAGRRRAELDIAPWLVREPEPTSLGIEDRRRPQAA
jgi:hypothetical protein